MNGFLSHFEKALKVAVVLTLHAAVCFALPPLSHYLFPWFSLCFSFHLFLIFLNFSLLLLCALVFSHVVCFPSTRCLCLYLVFLFFLSVSALSYRPSPFAGLNCKKSLLKFGGHQQKRKVQATFSTPRHICQKYHLWSITLDHFKRRKQFALFNNSLA